MTGLEQTGLLDETSLQAWLDDAVALSGVPGASVAVASPSGVLQATAGVLNVATADPVTPDSVFQIGSTAKVMTAVLVMQLVESGAIDLDSSVSEYLPELRVGDADLSGVTARQLLDHTSGLPGNHFADFGRGDDSLARYVASLASLPMAHDVGAMFSYCNAGYVVAGRLVETLTGVPFRDLLTERVAEPLGLVSTTTRIEDVFGRRHAAGHEPDGRGGHRVADLQVAAWSSTPAGSQAMSTAEELARFARVAMGSRTERRAGVCSLKSTDLMVTPSVDLPCPYWGRASQGLGWGVDIRGGRTVLLHGGGTTGQSAMMLGVPDADLSIAVLTNSSAGAALLGPAEQWLLEATTGVGPPRTLPDNVVPAVDVQSGALMGT